MPPAQAFRGFRFPAEVILWAVRWYLQFPVSYRDLERMLADRGVSVDHTTLFRWIQAYAPELDQRPRPHLCPRPPCRRPLRGRRLAGRGVSVDHTPLFRWIQAYAPELDQRLRPHLRRTT